jgi:hypothetical protein
MKKINSIAIGFLFLLLAVSTNAQSKAGADFFAGKWKVLVTGTLTATEKNLCIG